MATELTQDSVLRFLLNNGGQVRNADLLAHYKRFIREDEERDQNRELFKRYVNSVATVRQEEGVSRVVLRKKYRVHLGDVAKNRELERQIDRDPKQVVSMNQERKPQAALPVPTLDTGVVILPAADIVTTITNNNNNNNGSTPSFEKAIKVSSPNGWEPVASLSSAEQKLDCTCPLKPAPSDTDSHSSGSGQSLEQPWESKATELECNSVYPAELRQLREADGCEQYFVANTPCAYYEVRVTPPPEKANLNTLDVNSYKHFQRKYLEEPFSKAWPPHTPHGQLHISSSTPCLLDHPVAPYSNAGLSHSNDSLPSPNGVFNSEYVASMGVLNPQIYGLPVDPPPGHASEAYLQLRPPSSLSSSHDSLSVPSPSSIPSDTGWPQGFEQEDWSGDDGVKYQGLAGQDGNNVRAFLRHSQEARLLSQLHQPSHKITPLHHSTGHLEDQDSRGSPRSTSPEIRYGPIARRFSSRLRSRMCRSLGEDLNQPFPEDAISARHNRLQLLSSTLSMGNLVSASSSRGQSSQNLSSSAGSMQSLGTPVLDGSFNSKHSSVPLDSREHDWFVKAASGTWTDIYALFREDPNLLSKRDFISGFTVVHWIAKHGDHRVLNTLGYGVDKAGMTLDVDAKASCGYTPLHLAAIHGHKKLIRLLVQKFKADVMIRDSSGKRPWQYLSKDENRDILEVLGAPERMIGHSPGMQSSSVSLPTRPASARVNVKRHTSIAALFKHKSHLRVSSSSEAF
ncbi:ankyrin repeat domain-containing protein SOWAHB-like [Xyrauchen texanus]|uniref:ankyrin repeat domain-containing protein SOWAHB-like n=1 Tax=Xyrauchen texanus TaxID=154827 RepID=UPI002241CC67|nr:ankyrin repeat domain-containing protein SOWAHB-like [Xyrauchen texanus]